MIIFGFGLCAINLMVMVVVGRDWKGFCFVGGSNEERGGKMERRSGGRSFRQQLFSSGDFV